VSDGAIIGLLESRLVATEAMGKERVRLLVTLLIDPAYRGLRLSRVIFDEFMRSAERSVRVLVRFRDGNRENLERLYRGLGFSRLEDDGEYGRSKEKKMEDGPGRHRPESRRLTGEGHRSFPGTSHWRGPLTANSATRDRISSGAKRRGAPCGRSS
jgi:hypothetical protein